LLAPCSSCLSCLRQSCRSRLPGDIRVLRPLQYVGTCDASGAVPITSNLVAVASETVEGHLLIDGCPCKDLKDPNQRTFLSFLVVQ
jgi:hypothetical protein